MGKGMKQAALASALSLKGLQNGVAVLESMGGATGKTRDAAKLLASLGVADRKVLIVVPDSASDERTLFARALQNLPKVVVLPAAGVNVYDVLNCETLLCVHDALSDLTGRFEK
jgi:large subunit ribosomal protein L4